MPMVWRRPERNLADAMAQIDAIDAARPLRRPTVDSEDHGVAFLQGDHRDARLHARPLFGQHEFAAVEILARRAQQDVATCSGKTCSP